MKQVGMLAIALAVSACGGGGGGSPDTGSARAVDLVGSWKYTDPATRCEDIYTHSSDGTFNYRSLDEAIVGSYDLTTGVGKYGRTLVALTATQDNGLADCNGISENDATGAVVDWYVEMPTNDEMHVYEGASDTEVLGVFHRQ